jgi:hypothetical protein
LIIKFRKPKILISKNDSAFIIHKRSKDITIPFDIIKSIYSITYHDSNTIVIKTDSNSYSITDIYDVEEVENVMNKMLKEFKSKYIIYV